MAIYNYFGFNQAAPIVGVDTYYTGTYDAPINSNTVPFGDVSQPGDVLKFSPGNSYGTDEILTLFFDHQLDVESMTVSDWDLAAKNAWFQNFMKKVGLERFILSPVYQMFFDEWEMLFGFEKLSGISLAYVNQDSDLQIHIGCNSYETTFFQDWIFKYSQIDQQFSPQRQYIADVFGTLKPGKHYISNVAKITYGGHADFVYSFATPFVFSEYVGSLGSLESGGGNMFVEILLGGAIFQNNLSVSRAHYTIVKNVPENDPTKGLGTIIRTQNNDPEIGQYFGPSGHYLGPFCIGDVLTVINDSVFTSRSNMTNVFTWTWFGNLTDTPTIWYLADASDPCNDYRAVPVYDQLFPLRVISECKYEDFD